MSRNNKSTRQQAAKQVGKSVGQQYTDTLPQLMDTVNNATQTVSDIAQGNIVGAVGNAVKTVRSGAKTAGKTIKHGWNALKNSIKMIFNDESWWNKYGIKPSVNPTRPMNPIFNTTITNDPTMGSVIKVIDLALNWNGLFESPMFNTIIVKYYEQIRNTLKSNLPYKQDMVKQYIINAIAIKIISAQIKRNLSFRNFSPSDSPNSYKLFRKRPIDYSGYGATKLIDIAYLSDENIAQTIVEWNTAVDIMNSIVLPPQINDFIDHYFGLVFASDQDNSNCQYISTSILTVDYYDYENNRLVQLNVNNIDPVSLIEILNGVLANYGMVIADLKHSGILLKSIIEPKYEQLNNTVYYDVSLMQALANAYTSESAVQNDNYIRLDTIPGSKDLYTTFIMLGALQTQFNDNPLNLPLLTPVCMSIKLENTSTLDWEETFIQNNNINLNELDFFAINIVTDISEDVYFTYSTAGTTTVIPISGTNNTGEMLNNITYDFAMSQGTISPTAIVRDADLNDNLPMVLLVPLFYTSQSNSGNKTSSMICGNFTVTLEQDALGVIKTYSIGEFNGIASYSANSKDELLQAFMNFDITTGLVNEPSPLITNASKMDILLPSSSMSQSVMTANGICFFGKNDIGSNSTSINITLYDVPMIKILNDNLAGIPSSGIYSTQILLNTNLSILNMFATSTANISAGIVTSSGYNGMAEWIVQQLDFHIPLVVKHRYTTNIDSDSNTYVTGTNLLKEAYIPYWYNIQDVLPVAYSMMNSLLSPNFINISKNLKNNKTNNTK